MPLGKTVTMLGTIGKTAIITRNIQIGRSGRQAQVKIVPPSGGIAIIVRNSSDSKDKVKITETGEYYTYASDVTDYVLYVYVQGDTYPRLRIRADGKLEWGGGCDPPDTGLGRTSPNTLEIRDNLNILGSFRVGGTVVISSDRILKNVIIESIVKITSAATVTSTSETLVHEVTPDTDHSFIAYVEGVYVYADNPSGSGCDLYFQVRAYIRQPDNTYVERNLHDWETVAEGQTFSDWLRWIHNILNNKEVIKSIRLYAYCSTTPAEGYEPSVQLGVVGLQV